MSKKSKKNGEMVVLLHGVGVSPHIMVPLRRYLEKQGYQTLNLDYPWKTENISELAAHVAKELVKRNASDADKLHFVGHSMGGLIIRQLIAKHRPANLGSVVMLGTPNNGSEMADWLHKKWVYKKIFGKASGQELTTTACTAFNKTLPGVDYDLGVIAGNTKIADAFNKLTGSHIRGPSDSQVSIESTKIDGMSDHTIIHYGHNVMMFKKKVWQQVVSFIEKGQFTKPPELQHPDPKP